MKTIAYLGPENTFTHQAAIDKFGSRCNYLHAATIEDVFHLVERRQANFGVVPIENSLEGAVTHTLDRFINFIDTPVKIHGEIQQPIKHCLILSKGVKEKALRSVFSHPQALAQCHRWLSQHLSHVAQRETSSTADAISYVLKSKKDRAAIGRAELAKQWHLRAIPIPEQRENRTRFLVLGLDESKRGKYNKTSILLALRDKPGALQDALVPFKRNKINLTKIESRPSKQKAWQYLFFIDIEGHISELRVGRALKSLEKSTSIMKILGSYPIRKY